MTDQPERSKVEDYKGISERLLRVALTGEILSDDPHVIADAQAYMDSVQSLLTASEKRAEEAEARYNHNAAMSAIQNERRRQIEVEGWTPEHDDEHSDGEMLSAAVIYLHWGTDRQGPVIDEETSFQDGRPEGWPWDTKWWKPQSRQRNLERAGALCLAEKERLIRAGRHFVHVEQKLGLIVTALNDVLGIDRITSSEKRADESELREAHATAAFTIHLTAIERERDEAMANLEEWRETRGKRRIGKNNGRHKEVAMTNQDIDSALSSLARKFAEISADNARMREIVEAAEVLNHHNVERAQVRCAPDPLYRDHMFADQRKLDEAFQAYYVSAALSPEVKP